MLQFSRTELVVLSLLLAIGLLGVGYRLASISEPASPKTSAPSEVIFTPAARNVPTLVRPTPPPTTAAATVKVHIVGAVQRPGLYSFPAGSRVEDVLRTAGTAPGSRLDSINLAAKLEDGQQITVAGTPQPTSAPAPMRSAAMPTAGRPSRPAVVAQKPPAADNKPPEIGIISLNTADQAKLENLPGVGPVTARKILDYRNNHSGFKSVDELKNVPGIGEKRFEQIRLYVSL